MVGKLTPLSCSRCGAPITEEPRDDVIRCGYCGQTHVLSLPESPPKAALPLAPSRPSPAAPVVAVAVAVVALVLAVVLVARHRSSNAGTDGNAAATSGPGDPSATYAVGEAVDVYWGSRWWPGKVLGVHAGGLYLVGYDGWSSAYDEKVDATRLRPR